MGRKYMRKLALSDEILMKIEKPYDATRVVALRRMVIDLETLDYII